MWDLFHCLLMLWNYKFNLKKNFKTENLCVDFSNSLAMPICSQSYGFPVVVYGYESWTIKKAELWRTDAFELWYWRRLLRIPSIARKSNQFILKEINPEYSLEGLMLKLKLQYFGHLMWRTDLFEKTLMLGKIEGRRRRGWQRMRWFDDITNWMDMSLSKFELQVLVMDREAWHAAVHGFRKSRTWLSYWTKLSWLWNWKCGKHCNKIISTVLEQWRERWSVVK